MAFTYKRRDPKDVEKRANQSGSEFEGFILDGFQVWSAKKGENWIRILPPTWEGAEHYGMDVHVHYQVGPDRGTVLCLSKMKNKPCPICEERARLSASGDEEEAKELKPGRRVLMYIVDRQEEEKGAQVWPAPWTVDRDIAKVSKDRQSGEMFYVDDPDEGYDITFDREGEKLSTKYVGTQLARKSSRAPKKALRQIEADPLPETLRWRTYDEVAELFSGASDEKPKKRRRDDDDDDDDEAPKSKRRAARDDDDDDEPPKSRKRVRDDDDDDDEPPAKSKRRAPRDDDEDDDEPPVKKKKRPVDDDDDEDDEPPVKKKKRPVDDDDDEPPFKVTKKKRPVDDEDDDEDDEPPVKKKKRPVDDEDDDEDDEPPVRKVKRDKKRPADDEDDDEPPPSRKKRPVDDDDEEPAPKSDLRARLAKRKKVT